MQFFRIKNYEEYQSKKADRNCLPWIKLHKKIMNDYSYGELKAAEKLMYIHMLLIADQVCNKFPLDAKWMRAKLGVNAKWDYKTFERLGFIEIIGTEENNKSPPRREENIIEEKSKHNITMGGGNSENGVMSEKNYAKWLNRFQFIWGIYPNKFAVHKARVAFIAHIRKEGLNYYRELAFAIRCEYRMQHNANLKNIQRSPPPGYLFFENGYKDFVEYFKHKKLPEIFRKQYKL